MNKRNIILNCKNYLDQERVLQALYSQYEKDYAVKWRDEYIYELWSNLFDIVNDLDRLKETIRRSLGYNGANLVETQCFHFISVIQCTKIFELEERFKIKL